MKTLHITLISDFICPWCYLGKTRLERVRQQLAGEINLDIEMHPYLLYPNIPKGGVPKSVFAKKTKPGMGRSLRQEAEKEGIRFNYKYISHIPNSLEAHRLVGLVADNPTKYQLTKQLFQGYFEEGKNIEDWDYLLGEAQKAGVSDALCTQFQDPEAGLATCKAQIQQAKASFVTVVPSMRFQHQLLISGLQSAEVLEKYIRRAAQRLV